MLERWIIASLLIAAIAGARLLLQRHWQRNAGAGECKAADTCLTGGCRSLPNLTQEGGNRFPPRGES